MKVIRLFRNICQDHTTTVPEISWATRECEVRHTRYGLSSTSGDYSVYPAYIWSVRALYSKEIWHVPLYLSIRYLKLGVNSDLKIFNITVTNFEVQYDLSRQQYWTDTFLQYLPIQDVLNYTVFCYYVLIVQKCEQVYTLRYTYYLQMLSYASTTTAVQRTCTSCSWNCRHVLDWYSFTEDVTICRY